MSWVCCASDNCGFPQAKSVDGFKPTSTVLIYFIFCFFAESSVNLLLQIHSGLAGGPLLPVFHRLPGADNDILFRTVDSLKRFTGYVTGLLHGQNAQLLENRN